MIDQHNNKIDIPMSEKAWEFGGKLVQDKQFLFNRFNTGNTLIIMNYGFHNKPITELLNNLEQMFDISDKRVRIPPDPPVMCGASFARCGFS